MIEVYESIEEYSFSHENLPLEFLTEQSREYIQKPYLLKSFKKHSRLFRIIFIQNSQN